MERIITSHNSKILNDRQEAETVNTSEPCNCVNGVDSCPIEGKCQTSAIVYKATITANDGEVKTYTGGTDRTFKLRHYGHVADAKDSKNRNNTKLAGYIWAKKDEGIEIRNIKWEVLNKCHKYAPGEGKCDVCLSEKLSIMKNREPNSLNKRSELMNKCLHMRRWKLACVKEK